MSVASFELTAGILRLHEEAADVGQVYSLAIAVAAQDGVATLKGLVGSHVDMPALLKPATRKAIRECLAAQGVHTIQWQRHKPEGVREIETPT